MNVDDAIDLDADTKDEQKAEQPAKRQNLPAAPIKPAPKAFDPGPALDRPLKQIVIEAAEELASAFTQIEALKSGFDKVRSDADAHLEKLSDQLVAQQAEADQKRATEAEAMRSQFAALRDELVAAEQRIEQSANGLRDAIESRLREIENRLDAAAQTAEQTGEEVDEHSRTLRTLEISTENARRTAKVGVIAAVLIALTALVIAILANL